MDDFIEDCYLDPTAENGSHPTSITAQSPSSFFTIDSDSDNETEEWIDINQKPDMLPPTDFLDELRTAIDDTDCDPGIIRKILNGRSLTSDIPDANQIRQIIWPALLGVAKREMKDITDAGDEEMTKVFKQAELPESSVAVATLFARSRGIDLKEPIGAWIHLLGPIGALGMPPSKEYTLLHPIATRLTPHTPQALKCACDSILVLLQYHEPEVSQKLSDLRVPLDHIFAPLLASLFAVANSNATMALWDGIFQINDCVLSIFMIVVLTINGAESLSQSASKEEAIRLLSDSLRQMDEEDVPDLVELALSYRDMTPRSHIESRLAPLFGARPSPESLEPSLCAEITASEAILSVACDPSCLSFVLFDVRTPDQFNAQHLQSTMHLEETEDGEVLVERLDHHIESLNMPPDETHVCLIGESDNDPNVISFVSQLLKQKRKYISIINGGFEAIVQHIKSPESQLDPFQWLVEERKTPNVQSGSSKFFSSFSKFKNSISSNIQARDLSTKIKAGFENAIAEAETSLGLTKNRPYRGNAPVFSIDDESGSDEDEEQLNMETFLRRKDLKGHWEANGPQNKKFIIALSSSQLIILQPGSDKANKWAKIKTRRSLSQITRITSKKKCPEFITFRYSDEGKDCFYISEAGDATREIKRQVVAVLEALGKGAS